MTTIPTFGFAGKARHGKDTCAFLLRDYAAELGMNFLLLPNALAVKARTYGILEGTNLEENFQTKPPHVRKAQQLEGTENGRDKYGADLWVRTLEAYLYHIEQVAPFIHGVIVPDVRFYNEVGALDFVAWIDSDRPTLTGAAARHRSETEFDSADKLKVFDGFILNNIETDMALLDAQVRSMFKPLLLQAQAYCGIPA